MDIIRSHLQKTHGWSQDNLEAFNSYSVNLIPLQTLGLLRGGTFFPVSVPIEDLDGVIVKDIAQMDDGQHSSNEEDAECMPKEIKNLDGSPVVAQSTRNDITVEMKKLELSILSLHPCRDDRTQSPTFHFSSISL